MPLLNKFTGTENVRTWVQDFESYCNLAHIDNNDRGLLMYHNLGGLAPAWARSDAVNIQDFAIFHQGLLMKFYTRNSQRRRYEIHSRKRATGNCVPVHQRHAGTIFHSRSSRGWTHPDIYWQPQTRLQAICVWEKCKHPGWSRRGNPSGGESIPQLHWYQPEGRNMWATNYKHTTTMTTINIQTESDWAGRIG